jgi:hypothetical protein
MTAYNVNRIKKAIKKCRPVKNREAKTDYKECLDIFGILSGFSPLLRIRASDHGGHGHAFMSDQAGFDFRRQVTIPRADDQGIFSAHEPKAFRFIFFLGPIPGKSPAGGFFSRSAPKGAAAAPKGVPKHLGAVRKLFGEIPRSLWSQIGMSFYDRRILLRTDAEKIGIVLAKQRPKQGKGTEIKKPDLTRVKEYPAHSRKDTGGFSGEQDP